MFNNTEDRLFWATVALVIATVILVVATFFMVKETVQLRCLTQDYAETFVGTAENISTATIDIKEATAALPQIDNSLQEISTRLETIDSNTAETVTALSQVEGSIAEVKVAIDYVNGAVWSIEEDTWDIIKLLERFPY